MNFDKGTPHKGQWKIVFPMALHSRKVWGVRTNAEDTVPTSPLSRSGGGGVLTRPNTFTATRRRQNSALCIWVLALRFLSSSQSAARCGTSLLHAQI